jgi:hypothetical protein
MRYEYERLHLTKGYSSTRFAFSLKAAFGPLNEDKKKQSD